MSEDDFISRTNTASSAMLLLSALSSSAIEESWTFLQMSLKHFFTPAMFFSVRLVIVFAEKLAFENSLFLWT